MAGCSTVKPLRRQLSSFTFTYVKSVKILQHHTKWHRSEFNYKFGNSSHAEKFLVWLNVPLTQSNSIHECNVD